MKILLLKARTVKGSFTVEASFLFPLLVLLIAFFLQTAISLYCEVEQASQDVTALQQMDSVKNFLRGARIESLKEIILQE